MNIEKPHLSGQMYRFDTDRFMQSIPNRRKCLKRNCFEIGGARKGTAHFYCILFDAA